MFLESDVAWHTLFLHCLMCDNSEPICFDLDIDVAPEMEPRELSDKTADE